MKTVMTCLLSIMFNLFMGVVLASVIGVDPAYGAACGVVGGAVLPYVCPLPSGALAGVYTEIWLGELVKKLRAGNKADWLNRIPDYSNKVNNDVIHLVDVGGDPDVLVNNTTYPIPIQDLEDGDIALGLDKFVTKATRVSDDQLYAISYDKFSSDVERHGEAILEVKYKKAAHALAPQSHTEKTPVIKTSGATVDGVKVITRSDVIKLKAAFDKMGVPEDGRILVLCSDHVNQLLDSDQKFRDQYYNYESGKIFKMYGFEIFEYVNCPFYSATGVKLGFKVAAGSTDHRASFAFYSPRMFKAQGATKMYYSEAAKNPTTQESLVNFRHFYIVLPKKLEAIGAIYSWDGSTVQATNQTVPTEKHWADIRDGIDTDKSSLSFAAAGGSADIEVITTKEFTYKVTGTGFTAVRNGKIVTVTSAANESTSAAVTGTIVFTIAGSDKTATVTLTTAKASA